MANFCTENRLPGIYGLREFADAGGLMGYGANQGDLFRRTIGFVDKILKGAKPSNLPVEQPTKFELVINLKTAKALGLDVFTVSGGLMSYGPDTVDTVLRLQ